MRRPLVSLLLVLAATSALIAADGPPRALTHRIFGASRSDVDAILTRPYGPDVPFGSTGARLWATSPQGWAFGDDVHWVYLTGLKALDLAVADDRGPLLPERATYYPSHVALKGATHATVASASFTFATDNAQNPLSKPYRPEKRWTCWSSGRRDDWYAVDFGSSRTLRGLKLWFFDDEPVGACRPPASFEVQRWDGRDWATIPNVRRTSARPVKGSNTVEFDPTPTDKVRLLLHHAGTDFYSGLYGFEPVGEGPDPEASPLRVTGVKFITPDDVLLAVLRVSNPTDRVVSFSVMPTCDASGTNGEVRWLSDLDRDETAIVIRAAEAEWRTSHHGFDVRHTLRFAVANDPPLEQEITSSGRSTGTGLGRDRRNFRYGLAPGEVKVFKAALSIRKADEPDPLDRVLRLPEALRKPEPARTPIRIAPSEQDTRDVLADQTRGDQGWYDANLPYFDCSNAWVRKMFYHRAYNLKKNLMDPRLGRLKWPTQSEGRWRSDWYANVISYGAGHQIRESRWLRDPKYWQGHVRTWAENERPDGIFPNDVKPAGPDRGRYTDWISSTAWDGYLVHPDKAFLGEVVDKLAANVRGWQKVYDPDGDGLLFVDDHWWTGMEWQPSFFADSGYKTDPKDVYSPVQRGRIERVDLTAYNFGNAANIARAYRALGRPEEAKEFEALAAKIADAVSRKMWDPGAKFFYSLRFGDKSKVAVKEVIGVYPFYFGMLPAGKGYESAWASILDPAEFWTPWPVASVSKKCPAYSQDGWNFPSTRGTGCMWNGPTWPHANAIVLSAMARTLREGRGKAAPLTVEKFWQLFYSFTLAQYRDQDLTHPWTGEFYNGDTAAWKTAERDYNHSTWIDLLIADAIGLIPREDGVIEVDPLIPGGWLDFFVLDGLAYRGHDVTIVWDAPGGDDLHDDGRSGLDVYLDGKLVASSPTLSRVVHDPMGGGRLSGGGRAPIIEGRAVATAR